VRCPVCSHRFQFNSLQDENFTKEEKVIPAFQFNPSKKEYFNLLKDLIYAPIDYFKTTRAYKKQSASIGFWKRPRLLIEILLFTILLLYLVRGLKTDSKVDVPTQSDSVPGSLESEKPEKSIAPIKPDPSEPSIDI
jgi:hypothetical protein